MAKLLSLYFVMVSLVILTTSCAPLQQAPLVYASKVSVGVDVSTTTTEQPGLSINLGYKQVDAAYVPVAVSKPCDKTAGTENKSDCVDQIYGLMKIAGSNDVVDSEVPKNDLEEAKNRIEKFDTIAKSKKIADEDNAKAVVKRDEIDTALKNFKSLNNHIDFDEEIDKNNLTTEDIKLLDEYDKIKESLSQAEKEVAKASASKITADEELNKVDLAALAADLKLVGGSDKKSDAYSVFGSFDANTKAGVEAGGTSANKAEASLIIGKVFSTGVASQNLTQGMRGYYTGIGVARCLTVGENIISEYKKTLSAVPTEEEKKKLQSISAGVINACYGGKDASKSTN